MRNHNRFAQGDCGCAGGMTAGKFLLCPINRQVLTALHRLTAHYEHCGDYGRAAQYARKQLELEPWNEEAQKKVWRCAASLGFRPSRRVSRREFGAGQ